jgi:choice-of-anchor C domain-containing protein
MKITMMLLMFCVLAFASAGSVQAQISNGSFEQGTANIGSFKTLQSGSTEITNFTVTCGSVDYIGTYFQASNGTRSVDLNGNEPGCISQTFATIPGATYTVTFDLSGNPDTNSAANLTSPSNKTLIVSADGSQTQTFSYDTATAGNTRDVMKYATQTYTFTATDSSTTLTFMSTTPGAFGPVLDNVSITQTTFPVCHQNNRNKNKNKDKNKDGEFKTLYVSAEDVQDHLNHGDTLGACSNGN